MRRTDGRHGLVSANSECRAHGRSLRKWISLPLALAIGALTVLASTEAHAQSRGGGMCPGHGGGMAGRSMNGGMMSGNMGSGGMGFGQMMQMGQMSQMNQQRPITAMSQQQGMQQQGMQQQGMQQQGFARQQAMQQQQRPQQRFQGQRQNFAQRPPAKFKAKTTQRKPTAAATVATKPNVATKTNATPET